ncbi:hypothetical protein CAPTEDRAFT_189562 [Capitella teleta]|uniref:G-protein coupled receptors family 1 profile domain-containing protein n=1 Tax=Capitella teleta TaxID=283909 RepID=R7UGP1_CAPTE|nr:hypothetical protein CAPTEDRAFT_189562 [Capitella teleta]|eukprot:ELU05714.1 hypothetical protein CAPTEDRAFT_189562 [Capitella teleta]
MDSTTTGNFETSSASDMLNTKPCILYYFIFGTLVCGLIIIVGLVGNVLSLIILGRQRKKSSTIHALCLLAVADSLLLIAYFISGPVIGAQKMAHGYYDAMNQGVFASVYINEGTRIFNQVSALLTMILMWQRYVAVCLPHKAKQLCTVRIVNRIAVCSSVMALAFYLPNFFLYSITTSEEGMFYPVSHPLVHNVYFQIIYSVILTYLVSYIIPVFSLLYMSVAILRSLKSHSNRSLNSQDAHRDLTKSSITIVVIFVICQSFQPIRRVLMWVYDPFLLHYMCGGDLFYFSGVPHFGLLVNSSVNFAIYILFAKGFRRKLIAILTNRNVVAPNGSSATSAHATAPAGTSVVGTYSTTSKVLTLSTTDRSTTMAPSGSWTDLPNVVQQ